MKVTRTDPPRRFRVGAADSVELLDCGRVHLDADEQVTLAGPSGRSYDVTAKSWGFYATPSLDHRLRAQGFKTALVRNAQGRHYIMLVENVMMEEFRAYLREQGQELCEWLDERCERLDERA